MIAGHFMGRVPRVQRNLRRLLDAVSARALTLSRRLALVAVAVCLLPAAARAQAAGRVSGVVTDSTSGTPLSAVTLTLVTAGARTAPRLEARTDEAGRYAFPAVPSGTYVLEVRRLGYKPLNRSGVVVADNASVTLNLTMDEAGLSLQAFVTTGVVDPASGTRVPFTVGRVTAENAPVPATNALETIQGKIAGASVVPAGQAGSGTNIVLRTPTSINKSNSPLIVVDGVIQTDAFGASSADLQSMDIESVEVVKGAAAASLYGARAAAGVIQITTRRGSGLADGTTRFSVRSEFGSNSLNSPVRWAQSHFYRVNDAGQYVDANGAVVPRTARVEEPVFSRFQDNAYPDQVYDQVDRFFDPGNFTRNSLNIAQNSGKTNWFFSFVNQGEDGVVLNSGRYQQNDFRLNLDHRPTDKLSFGVSVYRSQSERQNLYGDAFFDLINQAPDVDLRTPDPDGTPYAFQLDPEGREENPLYVLSTEINQRRRSRTQGSLQGRYAPLSWLTFDGNMSFDRSDRRNNFFLDAGVKTEGFGEGGPGEISLFTGTTDAVNAWGSVNLLRKVGDFTLRATGRALLERETNALTTAEGNTFATPGVQSLDNAQNRFVSSSVQTIRTNSYIGSVAADYNGKYIADALLRQDGSSLFGPDEQENMYYRVSGAYRMSQESWWPFQSINEFKLRASQGTAGTRPDFNDQYETFSFSEGGGVLKQNLGNRLLKPEESRETEVGIDAIIRNRVSVQLSYADVKTTDQLILIPLAGFVGYNAQWQNAGTVTGNTYEATIEADLVKRPNFSWRAGLVGSRSRNRITEFNRACFSTNTIQFRCVGETLGAMYGFRFIKGAGELPSDASAQAAEFAVNDDGLLVWVGAGNAFTEGETKQLWGTSTAIGSNTYLWGMPITARDSTGSAALVKIGDGNPDFNFGISNNITWRGVSLFMLWDAQVGGNAYNQTNQRMYQYGRSSDVDQNGKPQELKKTTDYYAQLYAANAPTDFFVESAGFVKLRELSVRYQLPSSFAAALNRLGASGMSVSLIGRNLLTFTDYKGYDPEVGNVLNRLDSFDYPRYRTITGSFEITF
jgi:TonB-linked SusC/RagA family outer membrane protein